MPRTKKASSVAKSSSKNDHALEGQITKLLEEEMDMLHDLLFKKKQEELDMTHVFFSKWKTKIPRRFEKRTFGEVRAIANGEIEDESLSTQTVLSDTTTRMNATRNITSNSKPGLTNSTFLSKTIQNASNTRPKRSVSARNAHRSDDEGYTTESFGSTSSAGYTRQSRSRVKAQTKRVSRSLSKQESKYKTPIGKMAPPENGYITPKCKTNAPIVLGRRPKAGEIAWSGQGSPLMVTSTMAPENTANINIPVNSDYLLSMLPVRGVRPSILPEVDQNTHRQLEILRDNLIEWCNAKK